MTSTKIENMNDTSVPRVWALHTARVQVWQMANIPMPSPVYRLETTVRLGKRGPQYVVTSDEQGGDMRVYVTLLPRRRAMRRCPRRAAIMAAVSRALPTLRPMHQGAS